MGLKTESNMFHKPPSLDQQTYEEEKLRLGNLCNIEDNVPDK